MMHRTMVVNQGVMSLFGKRTPEWEQELVHQCASFGLRKSSGSDSGSNIYGWICFLAIVNLSQYIFCSCFIYIDVNACERFLRKSFACLWLFSSAHSTPSGARLFSERSVKYLSFINLIKLKILQRMKNAILLYKYSTFTWNGQKLCVLCPL